MMLYTAYPIMNLFIVFHYWAYSIAAAMACHGPRTAMAQETSGFKEDPVLQLRAARQRGFDDGTLARRLDENR